MKNNTPQVTVPDAEKAAVRLACKNTHELVDSGAISGLYDAIDFAATEAVRQYGLILDARFAEYVAREIGTPR